MKTAASRRRARNLVLLALLTTIPSLAAAGSAVPRNWKSCPTTYDAFHADLEARREQLETKLAGLSDDQVFQFTKSGTLDARLLRLLWPDLARDPISAAMWSGCLSWWGTLEAALKEQNRAHLKEAIDLWESCQVDAYREELTPPATELLACARSLAKSWPGK